MTSQSRAWRTFLLVGLIAIALSMLPFLYRPDRPVSKIVPGSSSGPEFVVQIIRPRTGLPLGGLLPPGLFGLDKSLGFDSASKGATVKRVGDGRVELSADDWDLALVLDGSGRATPESYVEFDIIFQERPRRVRCQPAAGSKNEVLLTKLPGTNEISGHFDIELGGCEDAATGVSLGWPAQPLILHGSFDRFRMNPDAQ